MKQRRNVPFIGRALDALAIAVVGIGAVACARSWFGLRHMEEFVATPDAAPFAAVARADELSRLGRIGVGIVLAGIALGIAAAIVARRATPPAE